MMFSASSKRRQGNENYSDPQNGQTLFEFLKRKKKVALQESLTNKSNSKLNKNQTMSVSKSFIEGDSNYTPINQTKRSINMQRQKHNMNINQFNSKTRRQIPNDYVQESLTPKRVRFADKQNQQQRSKQKERKSALVATHNQGHMNRSFIDLISPFKRKQDRSPTPTHGNYESKNLESNQSRLLGNQSIRNQSVKSGKQHYSRRNLIQSIKLLKDTLHNYIETGKGMKEKAHSIFVQIKPILKFTQQNTDDEGLYRKTQELKLKLRTFENMFKSFDVQNSSSTIQSFHRTLSQHLNTIQAELRQQYEKKDMNNAMRLRSTKDCQIQELQDRNRKLQKQNDILSRRLEKLQFEKEDLQAKLEYKEADFNQAMSAKLSQFHDKTDFYNQQIEIIRQQLQQSQQRQRQLTKKVKDAEYIKSQHQRKFREETQNIVSSKQQYLLNEVMMLKKEFQTDMAQITTLYNNKEADNLITIRNLQDQINDLLNQRQQDKILHQSIIEEANLSNLTANKMKKQNQCLVTDMTRMNEELYQHWLALKDIKTLSTRLQVFGKFMRIYDDLAFNDHLFG